MKNILHLLPVLMLALSACANRPTYAETLQPRKNVCSRPGDIRPMSFMLRPMKKL